MDTDNDNLNEVVVSSQASSGEPQLNHHETQFIQTNDKLAKQQVEEDLQSENTNNNNNEQVQHGPGPTTLLSATGTGEPSSPLPSATVESTTASSAKHQVQTQLETESNNGNNSGTPSDTSDKRQRIDQLLTISTDQPLSSTNDTQQLDHQQSAEQTYQQQLDSSSDHRPPSTAEQYQLAKTNISEKSEDKSSSSSVVDEKEEDTAKLVNGDQRSAEPLVKIETPPVAVVDGLQYQADTNNIEQCGGDGGEWSQDATSGSSLCSAPTESPASPAAPLTSTVSLEAAVQHDLTCTPVPQSPPATCSPPPCDNLLCPTLTTSVSSHSPLQSSSVSSPLPSSSTSPPLLAPSSSITAHHFESDITSDATSIEPDSNSLVTTQHQLRPPPVHQQKRLRSAVRSAAKSSRPSRPELSKSPERGPLLHPLARSPSGSLENPLPGQMPTNANSANAAIPLQMVPTVTNGHNSLTDPLVTKLTYLQRASTVTGAESPPPPNTPVAYTNPVYNNFSTSRQSTSTSMNPLFNANGATGAHSVPVQPSADISFNANITSGNGPGPGGGGQHLTYKPYPNPKSSTAPSSATTGPNSFPIRPQTTHARCHHHNFYGSSGSFEDGRTNGMTTEDDDTCSLSTTPSKNEDESFSLKFPKLRYVKVALLAGLILYTLISFIAIQEKEEKWTNVAVQENVPAFVDLSHSLDLMFPVWKLRARGSFLPVEFAKLSNYSVVFSVVQLLNDSQGGDKNGAYRLVKGPWAAAITPPKLSQYMNTEVEHVFKLTRGDAYDHIHRYQLRIDTNSDESVGLTVNMAGFSELSADGIILAAAVLVFLYTLIIFEIVNRTLAAMLGATAAITCLTLIRDRPSLEKVVSWLDVETLCLLFGMMVLVAILCETGFFDYVAVIAFRIAKGRTWPLIFTLCFFTGVLSAFLDNVTTILLMTPITIRLCEIKNIDPKLVLIAQVMFSNIGGAATPVGDPPNVIIISSSKIQQQGVDFGRFTLHMMPGIVLSFIATLIYIRFCYRHLSSNDLQEDTPDAENGLEPKPSTTSASISYQATGNPNSNAQARPQSEPQFGTPGTTGATIASNAATGATPRTTSMFNPESSSDFEGSYNFNKPKPAARNRMLRSASGIPASGQTKEHIDQCFSCNSMEDFCAGTSMRDSILDERRVFRSSDELKREIEVWKRATNSISGYSRDENSVRNVLNRKVEILETILQEHCYETVPPEDNYATVLAELEEKYKIRDYPLLYKSGIVMSLVISLFFMQSIPNLDLSLGWIAILGATLLLVLADRHELESIISRVEWSTLIFFAALFVVMEALAELKFLWWIGRLTQDFINSVPEAHRLVVAILLFTWISALASSFIDNIPLTTVMVKILEDLAENNEFNIPLMPLIYALAFGACLGGNGTLIGASSNVVCAGVAEQHGYRFTFMDFFKVGFPIMLLTVGISSVYLIVCHVIFDWNY